MHTPARGLAVGLELRASVVHLGGFDVAGHVDLAVPLVVATVVFFLELKRVRLSGADEAGVAPERGDFVCDDDCEEQKHGDGEDGGRVEEVEEALLAGEDGEGCAAGAEHEAAHDDGDVIEGVGFVAADQEEEHDERDDEHAETGPEVEVGQEPGLLCDVDGFDVCFELVDGHLDAEAGVDSV